MMARYTDEELSINDSILQADVSDLSKVIVHFAVELFTLEYPEESLQKQAITDSAYQALCTLVNEVNINGRDLVCMFVYVSRYYDKFLHPIKVWPKGLLIFSAFLCISTHYDEAIDKDIWIELWPGSFTPTNVDSPIHKTKNVYRKFVIAAIEFARELDFRVYTSCHQLKACVDIILNNNSLCSLLHHYSIQERSQRKYTAEIVKNA